MRFKRQALFWGPTFLLLVALILHVYQLFAMAAALICLRYFSYFIGALKLRGIEASRELPQHLSVGERAAARVTLRNTTRARKVFFTVADPLPAELKPDDPGERAVAILEPQEAITLQQGIAQLRRGVYAPPPVVVRGTDPLGLREFGRQLDAPAELIVYPQTVRLPYLWPVAAQGPRTANPRRRLRGEGDDFYGVRDYLPGDDSRRISWRASARRGKLIVVERERPESLHGVIVLDLDHRWHRGVDDTHTLEYGVILAASLMEQAMDRGSAVGLVAVGAQDHSRALAPEAEQRLRILDALARVQADGPDLAQALAEHAHLPRRAAVTVISPTPEARGVAAHLRGLGHAVGWFLLDANTFPGDGPGAEYGRLQGELAASRCQVRRVRGDAPLTVVGERKGAHAHVPV